jgi:GTPase
VESLTANAENTRTGFVALIGAPNAGKSTLMNRLIGTKVSIVTHKVQTTRAVIRGILTTDDTQIVFVDTPGIFRPRRRLDTAMVASAWGGARDADIVLCLVDAERGVNDDVERLLDGLAGVARPTGCVINKIDRVPRPQLLLLAEKISERAKFERIFMISALRGDGCDDLVAWLRANLPPGPFLYPEDEVSDLPMRQLAAEITREKLYERLHEELPYASHVVTDAWQERADGSIRIDQTIYVERDSQKKIVLGKNGSAIKAISVNARRELAQITGQRVHLFLFVKVRANWGDDPERYREIGLEFPR